MWEAEEDGQTGTHARTHKRRGGGGTRREGRRGKAQREGGRGRDRQTDGQTEREMCRERLSLLL